MNEYAGKKAVVTGGTQGMGLAIVGPLLGRGAEVPSLAERGAPD